MTHTYFQDLDITTFDREEVMLKLEMMDKKTLFRLISHQLEFIDTDDPEIRDLLDQVEVDDEIAGMVSNLSLEIATMASTDTPMTPRTIRKRINDIQQRSVDKSGILIPELAIETAIQVSIEKPLRESIQ
jgi:hypothetical protein